MITLCGTWDESDPNRCFQSVLFVYIGIDCKAQAILMIVLTWFNLLSNILGRSMRFKRMLRRVATAMLTRGFYKFIPSVITVWLNKMENSKFVAFCTSNLVRTIRHYVSVVVFPGCLFFRVFDLKNSNAPILKDDSEKQWAFGQIMPMVMLLTVPISIAKAAWG